MYRFRNPLFEAPLHLFKASEMITKKTDVNQGTAKDQGPSDYKLLSF